MLAREGQHHPILRTHAIYRRGHLLHGRALVAHRLSQDGRPILRHQLLTHALVAMLRHRMGHLMPNHHGQLILRADDLHQPLIHHDLTSRHTESIHLIILHQVKLPSEVLHLALQSILFQILLGGSRDLLSHTGHHGGLRRIARLRSRLDIIVILRQARREHLLVRHQQHLLTPRQGNARTTRQQQQGHR